MSAVGDSVGGGDRAMSRSMGGGGSIGTQLEKTRGVLNPWVLLPSLACFTRRKGKSRIERRNGYSIRSKLKVVLTFQYINFAMYLDITYV